MPTRRDFLALAGAAAGAAACDRVTGEVSRALGADVPASFSAPTAASIDSTHHLLSRAAFGPWPGDVDRVRALGHEAWLDAQLEPSSLSDLACDVRTNFIETVQLPTSLVTEFRPNVVEEQLVTHTLLRAVYSTRQLQEVMVQFWTDHFNIAIGKSLCRHLKTADDREVIREHALGSFRDLLGASARSAAMLVYLDGRDNKVSGPTDKPNENYARELLELHTLGAHGGYTQADVMEAARCLSGWVVREKWAPGEVRFEAGRHDDGAKRVLGQHIPAGGGAEDVDRLLDVIVGHPSCAQFLATKLCRWFVADDPPASLIARAAQEFRDKNTHIAPVLRLILLSPEFQQARGQKLKRPLRFVVSTLRALGADTNGRRPLHGYLLRLGQLPFQYPTPDGYPHEPEPWLGTLLWRWNFALSLCEGQIRGTRGEPKRLLAGLGVSLEGGAEAAVQPLLAYLYGRAPSLAEAEPLRQYLRSASGRQRPQRALALALSSPSFQLH